MPFWGKMRSSISSVASHTLLQTWFWKHLLGDDFLVLITTVEDPRTPRPCCLMFLVSLWAFFGFNTDALQPCGDRNRA